MQIEHTLVKAGARDSSDAIPGHIPTGVGGENYLVRIVKYERLLSADLIFDYSTINEANVKTISELSLYNSKLFTISPALYELKLDSFDFYTKRKIGTITLFGNPNEGRRKIFSQQLVEMGVQFRNINQCFEDIENLYRSTKIIVNIRQTDHHDTLEELRILPALRCGVLVVSEYAPLAHLTRYSDFIIWGTLSELPSLVLDVQNNYEKWHKKIFGNPSFFRRMKRISRRNELVSLRALNQMQNCLMYKR